MVFNKSTWPLGVGLELISTLSGTIGKELVRFSETHRRKSRNGSRFALCCGLVLNTVFGPVVDMAAYSFAPASLIAPFGGLDIVWNILLAPCVLGEQLTCRRCFSALLIFFGTFASVFFANKTEVEYTNAYVVELLFNWRALLYFVLLGFWLAFLCFLLRCPRGSVARGFALGAMAGSIAGNLFCVKITAELIKTAIVERTLEDWKHWVPYVVLFLAIFFAVSNVFFLTRGLQEYEALFMVPIYEGSQIVVNALSAIVVLREMDAKAAYRIVFYSLCICLVMAGIAILVSGERAEKLEDELEDAEELESITDEPSSYAESEEDEDDDEYVDDEDEESRDGTWSGAFLYKR